MKLILASDITFLLEYGYVLTGIPKEQMKIGYVTTSAKGGNWKEFFDNVENIIQEAGYNFEKIDIESKTKEEIKDFFKDKNIVHLEGGSTYYLLRAIRATGFDQILRELLKEGKVFVGISAGAYVMCPTIEVADWNEQDRFGVTDFTGLNYVPFLLKVHYKDDQEVLVREKINSLKYPLRILRDGQGIVVEENKYTFIGDGVELKLS